MSVKSVGSGAVAKFGALVLKVANLRDPNFSPKDTVRTDFILQNIFCYLANGQCVSNTLHAINIKEPDVLEGMKEITDVFHEKYITAVKSLCREIEDITEETVDSVYLLNGRCSFDAISAINKKERDVLEGMKETTDAFRESYATAVKSLCSEIKDITEETVGSVLLGVSNELFSEGITWSRIIAFFVFVGELTHYCLSRNLSKSIVNVIYDCFSRFVKEKLESWIDDHDGWEGITSLSVVTQQENQLMSNPGWIASFTNQIV